MVKTRQNRINERNDDVLFKLVSEKLLNYFSRKLSQHFEFEL
jgi:hypothetical protein